MILVVYSHPDEIVTKILRDRTDNLEEDVSFLSVEELLNDTEIFDVIDDGEATLSWKTPTGQCFTNDNETKLVNRVDRLPQNWIDSFVEEDRRYALSEANAYLSFALSSFAQRIGVPDRFGLGVNNMSTLYVWSEIKRYFPDVDVPDWFLGPKGLCPFSADRNDIHVALCDASQSADDPQSEVIAYTAPRGRKVQAAVVNDSVLLRARDEQDLPAESVAYIERMARNAAAAFNLVFGTVDGYFDDPSFVVWDVSATLDDFAQDRRLSDLVIEGVNERFRPSDGRANN